jgi:lysozyme
MNEDALRQIIREFIEQLEILLREQTKDLPKPIGNEGPLTKRAMIEIVSHEGIVLESYKDSKGIWTWGVGVTDASGHHVGRYKDNPQSIAKVVEIYKWLLETKYLPPVLQAFKGVKLSESQLAAAVSFHYNTGAIGRASWVRSFKEGKRAQARREFLQWKRPPEIFDRRKKEAALFFDGLWSNSGLVTVYTKVNKPSYTPNWKSAKRIDITKELA